ncbi:MAG TPA: patatin-like phospholipase family protein [Bryobacteraceae bacterium]|nr:patatin-like phospholipase family protein [Bryobacteraceae bacterium]
MSRKQLTDSGVSIALALSGGGFRASLFHLGALRRLNDAGLLSRMTSISSVSGGSITNGLLAAKWGLLERDAKGRFTNFGDEVEKPLRAFCGANLRNYPLIFGRLNPLNWKDLARRDYSATNLLVERYNDDLLDGAHMGALAGIRQNGGPSFVFCATNMQTGVNWVFDDSRIGDYMTGYTFKDDLKLAVAVAASSAFPLAFPPLAVQLDGMTWSGGKMPAGEELDRVRNKAVLSDGGVYDNMGLEPVWKSNDFVFCSDAGAPFSTDAGTGGNMFSRLKRSNDIIDRQSRALRKRMLIQSFERGDFGGAYWGIATAIGDYPLAPRAAGYEGETLERIAAMRTDLDEFKPGEQAVLMNHGWLLAGAALRAHCPEWKAGVSAAPDEVLLINTAALSALDE